MLGDLPFPASGVSLLYYVLKRWSAVFFVCFSRPLSCLDCSVLSVTVLIMWQCSLQMSMANLPCLHHYAMPGSFANLPHVISGVHDPGWTLTTMQSGLVGTTAMGRSWAHDM